jgi:hypothetical protein
MNHMRSVASVLAAAGLLTAPAAGADPTPGCGQTSQPCPPPTIGEGFYVAPGGAGHPAPPPPADRRTPGSQAPRG